jgi:hypothetical protein
MTKDCEKRTYKAGQKHFSRECDYLLAGTRARLSKTRHSSNHKYEQASYFAGLRSRRGQPGLLLAQSFREQVDHWKDATGHLSSVTRAIAHPSYLRIIGLAKYSTNHEIERLLLRELESEPDHWFAALNAITGEDPVKPEDDFDAAATAWLDWGRNKQII